MKRIAWLIAFGLVLHTALPGSGSARRIGRILALKRFCFEFSVGASLDRPATLPLRATATDTLMRQYADGVGASMTEEGRLGENILGLPVRAALAFRLDNYWTIKAGLDLSSGGDSSEKSYDLDHASLSSERFALSVRNRLLLVSPFVEAERLFGRFSLFAGAGLQWGRLSHTYAVDSISPAYTGNLTEEITATGMGPLVYVGGAYRYPLGEVTSLLIRLEVRFSTINKWNGDKVSTESLSSGEDRTETVEGDLTRYEWNPYGAGWVEYWDTGNVTADGVIYRDPASMSSRFSGIRFTLGICF